MKSYLLPLFTLVVFASCTTAYKSGQTPDDVYYSPARPAGEYVRINKKDEDRSYRRSEDDYYSYSDDRYLRMKIQNRNRWSYLDDYYRDPYAYHYNSKYYYNQQGYSNPRSYWNSYYNPYGGYVIVTNPRVNRARTYNLHVFDNPQNYNNTKVSRSRSKTYTSGYEQNNNQTRNTGNDLRTIFRDTDNSSNSKPASTQGSSGNSNSSNSNTNSSSGSAAPKRKS